MKTASVVKVRSLKEHLPGTVEVHAGGEGSGFETTFRCRADRAPWIGQQATVTVEWGDQETGDEDPG